MPARLLVLTLLLLSAPLRAGENVWTPIGPEGGTVSALAFAPNGRTVYAGTSAGQVFKSINTGRTWSLTAPLLEGAVQDLETDPSQSARVYAATSKGIWRSDDAGRGWWYLTNNLPGVQRSVNVLDVAVDPLSPNVVYLSVNSGFAGPARVLRSTDRGTSWELAASGLPGIVRALAVHPRKRGVLFAATPSGVFRSGNSGRTWERSGLGGSDVVDVVIDPGEPSRLYAVRMVPSESSHVPPGPQVLFSEDGGGRWTPSSSTIDGVYEGHIAADPLSPGTAYFFSQYSDIYKTTDAGRNWTPSLLREPPSSVFSGVQTLTVSPVRPGTLLMGTSGGQAILRSVNGGDTWSSSGSGLRALAINRVDADPTSPGVLYADLWKTVDGGRTWSGPGSLPEETAGGLTADAGRPSTLYLASYLFFFKSTDRGMTWTRIGRAPADAVQRLVLAAPGTLYAANLGGIYRSTDDGVTWQDLISTYFFDTRFLAVAPSRPSTLYAVNSEGLSFTLLRSTDAGATWTTILQPGQYRWIESLAVDPHDPDRVLVAFSRRDENIFPIGGGVYRTLDGGATWQLSRPGAGNPPAYSLLFDPRRPSRVYAGTSGAVSVSENAGLTWGVLGTGLPDAMVLDLEVDPFDPDTIYAATGGGLYSLTRTTGN
ncbi:MAG TPA: hypothetical protein VMW27_20085 [Thermoanaerobaculia bacterium]|nr:hypothetical protein [Thermoanaerobaculia bacterium]